MVVIGYGNKISFICDVVQYIINTRNEEKVLINIRYLTRSFLLFLMKKKYVLKVYSNR